MLTSDVENSQRRESSPPTPGAGTHSTELQGEAQGPHPFLYPQSLTHCGIIDTTLPTEPRGALPS